MKVSGMLNPIPVLVVGRQFSSNQDWTGATALEIKYQGAAGNSPVDLELQILNGSNQEIADVVVSLGAQNAGWNTVSLSLGGVDVSSVKAVQLAIGIGSFATQNTMYFDDLVLVRPVVDGSVTATPGTQAVSEAGGADTVTVSIGSQPTHNVTITPVYNADQLTVSPATRTITPAQWESGVSFSVGAVDDDDIEGAHTSALSFGSSSSDPAYQLLSSSSITMNISDNDFLVQPDVPTPSLNEDGKMVIAFYSYINLKYTIEEAGNLVTPMWTPRVGRILSPFPLDPSRPTT